MSSTRTMPAPGARSAPEQLWTLREPLPGRGQVRCGLCVAVSGYELLLDNHGGQLRWRYHSLAAAQQGATRLRARLLASGWSDPERG